MTAMGPHIERNFIGYGQDLPQGTWPNGSSVAVNFVVNIEEGSERSFASGDDVNEGLVEVPRKVAPGVRDYAVESMYEFGSRVGCLRLLSIFASHGVQCSAFTAAQALEKNPTIVSALRAGEHEVCGHGYRWAEAWNMTEEEERKSIEAATRTIEELCGTRPIGWYCRWMPSAATRRLLVEEGGYLYDSDAYNDEIPYYVQVVGKPHLVVPYSATYNDSLFSYGHMSSPSDFVDYCQRGIDFLAREANAPRLLSIGLHPRIAGQAARADAVRQILEFILNRDDVWIATRAEIAQFWLANHPPM